MRLPVKILAVPPAPTDAVPTPLKITFPPVLVPALVPLPALSVRAVALLLVVLTTCETVKLPLTVAILTTPVAVMPLVLPTVSSVSALASTYDRALTPLAAKVPMALLTLVSETLPPESSKLLAVKAALCVTLPELARVMVLPVAVSEPSIAMPPPMRLTGPATVVALASVMPAVLPTLPIVRPPRGATLSKFQVAVLKFEVKLVPLDWMVSVPGPLNWLDAVVGASF